MITEEHTLKEGYAVVLIQFAERRVQLRHYSSEMLEDATRYYSEVEKSINDENAAVVVDVVELRSGKLCGGNFRVADFLKRATMST